MLAETCWSNIVVTQKHMKTIICLKSVMARVQQGYGLGNLFSSIAKSVLPLVKKGAKTLGKQVLQSNVDFASDVLQGKNVKQAAIDQAKAAGTNLLQAAQRKQKAAPRKIQKKKRKKHHDIFT